MSSVVDRLARVNSRATRKFSELSSLNGRPVYGVYEAPYSSDTFGVMSIDNSSPTFVCLSADVSSADHRQSIVVREVSYIITKIALDAAGDSVLHLERA